MLFVPSDCMGVQFFHLTESSQVNQDNNNSGTNCLK